MSNASSVLEHNKEMVDQFLLEKKITLAETVANNGGQESLFVFAFIRQQF